MGDLHEMMSGPASYKIKEVLIGMIIYSVIATILTLIWVNRYYSSRRKSVNKSQLIILFISSILVPTMIGNMITNIGSEISIGRHLDQSKLLDFFLTIVPPIIPAIFIGSIFGLYKKKKYMHG